MRTAFLGVLTSAWISILAPVHAATFLVTNLANAGPGSLRQAVLDANATAGADDVTFQSGLSGTIVLSGGPILSDDDLVVHGNTSIVNNSAGLPASGELLGFGGGIYLSGGALTIENSTLAGNSVWGGVFRFPGAGAGLWAGGSTVHVINSTFSGNGAWGYGSAAFFDNSTVYLALTTVNENHNWGFWSGLGSLALEDGAIHLDHSIVANTSGSSPEVDLFRSSGTINAVYSLVETPGSAINGTSSNNVLDQDPKLAPLQYNGGPTATHALLPGSPAFNRGDPGITDFPAFDQRGPGFPRVVNGTVDIGSFESQDLLSLTEVPLLSPVGLLLLVGAVLAAGLRALRGRLAGR